MRRGDQRQAFLIESCDVRGQLVQLDSSWRAASSQVDYPDTVRHLLGEALASVALLTGTLKFEGRLGLQLRGHAALEFLVAQMHSSGRLRGLARWREVPADYSLHSAFGGDAQMNLLLENENNGETWRGIVAVEGETLSEALAGYFANSEQLPTELYLAVNEHTAAGLLLQRLPQPDQSNDADGWNRATTLAGTLQPEELLQLDCETLLTRLFHQERLRLFDPVPLSFHCDCTRERCDSMLQSLGAVEVQSILDELGEVSIDCEFCGAHYGYDPVDARALFQATLGFVSAANSSQH